MDSKLQQKRDRLHAILREMGGCVIGFSGGVDSTYLFAAAVEVLGDRVLAVTASSETYPERERREAEELAGGFKLLADPIRLRILSLIANAPGATMCGCDLPVILDRSQPTVSHHLSLLTDAGLLTREQRGKWAWFSVEPGRVSVLRDALSPG